MPIDDAVIRGLRRPGDETQFTQVLAAVASAQPEFASALVRVLLDAARARHPEKVDRLEPVPDALSCRAEVGLGEDLGRLDLRFDDESNFTIFVENKLYSGYGDDQVDRYLAALECLPSERNRSALIAVTRDVPGYGEPPVDREGWLGSVRWATVIPELRNLPLPAPLDEHWRVLLNVMYEEGDLGVTEPNTQAIQAWALYATGRDELSKLLMQVRDLTLGALHELMAARYPDEAVRGLVDHHTFGRRGKVAVKHELTTTWIGFRIPTAEKQEPGFAVQFSNALFRPLLMVEARPFIDEQGADPRFTAAAIALRKVPGIYENRGAWGRSHEPSEWLNQPDVPAAMAGLIQGDAEVLVSSGIFDADITEAEPRRRGLGRWRRGRYKDE